MRRSHSFAFCCCASPSSLSKNHFDFQSSIFPSLRFLPLSCSTPPTPKSISAFINVQVLLPLNPLSISLAPAAASQFYLAGLFVVDFCSSLSSFLLFVNQLHPHQQQHTAPIYSPSPSPPPSTHPSKTNKHHPDRPHPSPSPRSTPSTKLGEDPVPGGPVLLTGSVSVSR